MPQDHSIKVGTITTRYWTMGDHGTPVILIHGLGASVDIWMHNVEALAQDHRVYALDLVGFGRADKPDVTYDPAFFATFLNDFINAVGIEKPSLVGNSLGGGIALQYALLYPDNVDKLVLVDNAGFGKKVSITLRLVSLPLVGELITYPTRMEAYFYFMGAVHDRSVLTREFVKLYHDIHSQPGAQKALLKVLRSIANVWGGKDEVLAPIQANLHRITQTTLIVWGKQDKLLPLKQAYVGAEKLPYSKLHVIDSCGHMPQFERPDVFNEVVGMFLQE